MKLPTSLPDGRVVKGCVLRYSLFLFSLWPLVASAVEPSTANAQVQQLQAQLNALNASGSAPATPGDAVGDAVANQILAQQRQEGSLPPSPLTAPSAKPAGNASRDVLAQISADQGLPASGLAAAAPPRPASPPASPSTNFPPPPPPANQPAPGLPQPAVNPNPGNTSAASSSLADMAEMQDAVNGLAFHTMVKNAFPMSNEQIQKLRSLYMASQYAASSSPVTPPRPTATSVLVDLSPGATPPVIRLAQGFVTSLVFIDSSGAPWPIASYDIGNPSAFNIQWDKISNTLMVQSTVLYTYGNLAVRLKGLNTPVMITLIPGQKAVDYRVDMRIPGVGPQGHPVMPNLLPAATGSDLLNVLDGVPPPNSKVLQVEGGDCQAWLSDSKMFVRTRLDVLSPGWDAKLSSADGMHAYEMTPTPMLLVSQHGQVFQLKVQGF